MNFLLTFISKIKSKIEQKLSIKFLVPTITLIVIGLGVSTTVTHFISRSYIEQQAQAQLLQIADSGEKLLSSWITIIKMDIERRSEENYFKLAVRESFMGQRARDASNSYLVSEKTRVMYYESFNAANTKGKIVCSSDMEKIRNFNVSDQKFFQESMKGNFFISDTFSSLISGKPVFAVSSPIKEKDIVGVFFGVVRLEYFSGKYIVPLKVGQKGHAYMTNKNSLVIAHPDNTLILKPDVKKNYDSKAKPGEKGLAVYYAGGVKKIEAFRKNPETGWTVAATAGFSDIMSIVTLLGRVNLLITAAFSVIMAIVIILAVKTILKPVASLVDSARTIAEGNYDIPVTSDSNDEIGTLVSDVDRMRLSIKDLTDNLELKIRERTKQLQETRDALWGEMELARKIQTVLLPEKPIISGYEIAASMKPAEEVGGDYYDVISVGGFDWIVIGDVSGHGVSAGLIMMMAQTSIHTVLLENPGIQASHLLATVNRIIYQNIEKMDETKHMTIIVLARVNDKIFTFSGLHEDILIWRSDTEMVDEIETSGMWIGIEPDIAKLLSDRSLTLNSEDCMVLFTDGITEAWDRENNERFSNERLVRIIEKFGSRSASELHRNIIDALEPYETPDDVTLVIIKRLRD